MLYFDAGLIFQGEVWRVLTWLFVPTGSSLWVVVSLFCYYSIGSAVENYWGSCKFTLFYLTGAVLTAAFALLSSLWSPFTSVSNEILNNMLFLAFATLYPTATIRLQLILPIQAKWLAIFYVFITGYEILRYGFSYLLFMLPMLLPVWLAYTVFFWDRIADLLMEFGIRFRHANSSQTVHFKSAVRQQKKREAERGYRHKCAVCGRTDTDFPTLEFRYCSRCVGYHCFCQDHIFNHTHYTE